MSAIRSLLRVMILREAEGMVLEARRPPMLRRRGQPEALAMPPLDPALIAEFAAPLLRDGPPPRTVRFEDDGKWFSAAIDRATDGLKLVVTTAPGPVVSAPSASSRSPDATAQARAIPPPPATPAPRPAPASTAAAAPDGAPPSGSAGGGGAAELAAQPSRRVGAEHGGVDHAPHRDSPTAPGLSDHARPAHQAERRLAALLAPMAALARARGASDLFVSTGQPARVRVDGRLEVIDHLVDDDELAACARALGHADVALAFDDGRLRVSVLDHLGGHAVVARLIRPEAPAFASLGLPAELTSVIEHREGLVLVCGPAGSGKSTTLAALLALLDERRPAHVISLEDPIEFALQPRRGLIHQRQVGVHVASFAAGLRAALRESPDVILLGELRDRETIAAALTAAETGHLVLATLHAPYAGGAIDRVLDAFPESQQRQVRAQLALALRAVITQHLVPRKLGGRAAAIELCPVTPAVASLIRKGELQQLPTVIQSGREHGMIPLERSLAMLVQQGAITSQVARQFALDHDLLGALAAR